MTRKGHDDEYDGGFDLAFAKYLLSDPEFIRVSAALSGGVTRDDGTFFEHLDPYLILRLLGGNPANLERDLVWGIHDVIAGGWVENDEVFESPADESKFLIVTESSSDPNILKTALLSSRPTSRTSSTSWPDGLSRGSGKPLAVDIAAAARGAPRRSGTVCRAGVPALGPATSQPGPPDTRPQRRAVRPRTLAR